MFMIPKYRSGRVFARSPRTSVVCRRRAEANALPSANRALLIVVPSILSADTRFPAASTTTTAMFRFWPRVNVIAPSMMTRASAREIRGGAKAGGGAGACARPGQLDHNSNRHVVAIARIDDNPRRIFMGTSVQVVRGASSAENGRAV